MNTKNPSNNLGQPKAVSFIVPALNEEKNIAGTVAEICRAAEILDDYELVLVDDGSQDRTGEIIDNLAVSNPRVRALHNPKNLGMGGAYKVGIVQVRLPYVIMIPGDNCHPASSILAILGSVGEADVVIPYVKNTHVRTLARRVISTSYTRLLNTLFWLNVPYYNGVVLHRTDLVRNITIETDGFAYQAESLIKILRKGASSVSVPIVLSETGDRNSRAFRFKNIMTVGETIWRLMRSR